MKAWICNGGMAAEFNVHHLVELDDATLNNIFRIRLHKQADDGSEQVVEDIVPTLRPWGQDIYGDVVSVEAATATWNHS